MVRRDLVRQAELMAVGIPEEIEVGNLEVADLKPVKVVLGRHNLSANVRFAMSHKLVGPLGCRTSGVTWLRAALFDY
jgi:hypothetical protein